MKAINRLFDRRTNKSISALIIIIATINVIINVTLKLKVSVRRMPAEGKVIDQANQ